jgi:hypothetical protein
MGAGKSLSVFKAAGQTQRSSVFTDKQKAKTKQEFSQNNGLAEPETLSDSKQSKKETKPRVLVG